MSSSPSSTRTPEASRASLTGTISNCSSGTPQAIPRVKLRLYYGGKFAKVR